MSYDEWIEEIDALLENSFFTSIHDLPDRDYRSLYEEGVGPLEVVEIVVKEDGLDSED